MQKYFMNLVEYLGSRSRTLILSTGLALVLLVGAADYLLGHNVSFFIFYLVPVSLVAWFAGKGPGLFMACICAATWLAADVVSEDPYSPAYVPLWNAAVRMGFFIVTVFLLDAFKREKSYAREDYLTGLGNRRYFFELADNEIIRSKRYAHPFTLAYLDVDGFKTINDRLGHAEGDALLKAIARAISGNIRATDIAARLGGDEFAVLLPESGAEAARKFFDKLHRRLSEVARKNAWPVSFSIGVATFITAPGSSDEMIRIGDNIMYAAKSSGKNTVKYEVLE